MSRLNPNAAPYMPILKKPSVGENEASKELMGLSAKAEEQSLVQLHVSNDRFGAEKQSTVDETDILIDFLVSRFPSYSAECLADFLKHNNGNLDDTMDFLEEFEDSCAGGVHVESSGTSQVRRGVAPTREMTSSSS